MVVSKSEDAPLREAKLSDWVVVTGAASGIGLEIARRMASKSPVLCVDTNGELLASTVEHLRDNAPFEVISAVVDVSDPGGMQMAVAQIPPQAVVRCLVNCAGIFDHYPAHEMPLEAWERVLRVNLTGTFVSSQTVFARLVHGSAIVNIGSINGYRALPERANYAASKAAVRMLTQCLAVEWAPLGIRVISVSPGIVDTPMNRRVEAEAGVNSADIRERIPLGRYAAPSEIASVVEFVASADASYLSGVDVLVDGAWVAFGAM
jgi:NAD(P)-dependent dehydrogenase (short-subunit alcohol dehydrogenase family)